MWEYSPSPDELWSDDEGGNEQGEWPIEGIVGEEINGRGESRYEVRWRDWKRADGTSTTWTPTLHDRPDLIARWKTAQKKIVDRQIADNECTIDVRAISTLDVHNIETRLRGMGYAEMIRRRKGDVTPRGRGRSGGGGGGVSVQRVERRGEILDRKWRFLKEEKDALDAEEMSGRLRPRKDNGTRSSASSPIVTRRRLERTYSSSTASSPATNDTPRSSRAHLHSSGAGSAGDNPSMKLSSTSTRVVKSQSRLSGSAGGSPSAYAGTSSSSATRAIKHFPKKSRRETLEKKWNEAAKKTGAASLRFVNDVDGESVPPFMDNFVYIEQEYIYADGIPRLQSPDCFVTCNCAVCKSATDCNCQDPSELDLYGSKEWAYDDDGLFTFDLPRGVEVIECNKYCSCPLTCVNRVAQRPRDIPIEIFKTDDRGWGARAEVDIIRGKVMGIYTGLLIRRETAEGPGMKDYRFDLDGKEGDDDDDEQDRYSVDSLTCGNWTRFINHSCNPNVRVYPVVYDTIPEMNMGYVAFVALQDIPARTELTFDYDPAAARAAIKGKGKVKRSDSPQGARRCMCGEEQCRGWVSV